MEKSAKLQQLDLIVERYTQGNKSAFARMIGLTQSNFNNWYRRDTIEPYILLKSLPDLSAEWLMRGVGPMILSDNDKACVIGSNNQAPIIQASPSAVIEEQPAEQSLTVQALIHQLETKDQQIQELFKLLNNK